MIRTILLLTLGAFVVVNAVNLNDLCRNGDKTECKIYCKHKFGAKLISSECKEAGNKRQCICKFAKQESDEFMIEDEDDEDEEGGSHSKHPKNPKKPNHQQNQKVEDEDDEDEEGGSHSKHPKNPKPHQNNGNGGNGAVRGPKHQGTPSCPKLSSQPLVPIYRMWYGPENYQVLSYVTHWIAVAVKGGWTFDNQKGLVAVNENSCNGKKLTPIYYVYNGAAKVHLFTADLAQVEQKKNEGYAMHPGVTPSTPAGAQFFCSLTPDPECGATVPLHRYWMNAGRYYYYPVVEGTEMIINKGSGRDDGVLCYVWPNYA